MRVEKAISAKPNFIAATRNFIARKRPGRHRAVLIGVAILLLIALLAVFAPYVGTVDPRALAPTMRLKPMSAQHWLGTDMLGRDLYSRVIFGGRVSLTIGFGVAILASGIGLLIGLVTGYVRSIDAVVMRIMDGMMRAGNAEARKTIGGNYRPKKL